VLEELQKANRIRQMPTLTFPPARILVLSLVGSLIVAVGAIAAVIALWQPARLEAIVPAELTHALFSSVTREDLRVFSDEFPVLRNVPPFEGRLDAAVIGLPAGPEGWILSQVHKEMPLPDVNGDYNGQHVLLSDPSVMAMMTGDGERLRSSTSFRHLSSALPLTTSRIYLRENAPTATNALPPLLRPFVRASGALMLSLRTEGPRTIATLGIYGQSLGKNATPPPLPLLTPPPETSVLLGNPAALLETGLQSLPAHEQMIRRGQLTRMASDLLGTEGSFDYDLLPLLLSPAGLHWSKEAFLFSGSMESSSTARETLAHLHDRFRSTLLGSTVVSRSFDKDFTSDIMKSDPSAVEDVTQTRGGWLVRITRQGAASALMSASHGREFVLSNNEAWLNQMIVAGRITLPGSAVAAGGQLGPSSIEGMVGSALTTPSWAWMGSVLPLRQGILWSAASDGQGITLSLTLRTL
jgi:hypothetical protein